MSSTREYGAMTAAAMEAEFGSESEGRGRYVGECLWIDRSFSVSWLLPELTGHRSMWAGSSWKPMRSPPGAGSRYVAFERALDTENWVNYERLVIDSATNGVSCWLKYSDRDPKSGLRLEQMRVIERRSPVIGAYAVPDSVTSISFSKSRGITVQVIVKSSSPLLLDHLHD